MPTTTGIKFLIVFDSLDEMEKSLIKLQAFSSYRGSADNVHLSVEVYNKLNRTLIIKNDIYSLEYIRTYIQEALNYSEKYEVFANLVEGQIIGWQTVC